MDLVTTQAMIWNGISNANPQTKHVLRLKEIPFVVSSTCGSTNSRAHLCARASQDNQLHQASSISQQEQPHPEQTSLQEKKNDKLRTRKRWKFIIKKKMSTDLLMTGIRRRALSLMMCFNILKPLGMGRSTSERIISMSGPSAFRASITCLGDLTEVTVKHQSYLPWLCILCHSYSLHHCNSSYIYLKSEVFLSL